jgi:hypothetical protein
MPLKNKANKILDESELVEILSKFGSPIFTGSYQYDLMTSQDIDLYLVVDNPSKVIVKDLVNTLINQGFWNRIKYGDFLNFPYPKNQAFLDKSFFVGLKRGNEEDEWNIDIWIITKEQELKLDYPWLKNINEEQKKQILDMKENKKELGMTSFEIYKKILN